MATQNITLALPKETLRRARLMAVERQTSLSRMLAGLIESMVGTDDRYEMARQRHQAILRESRDLGTGGRPSASRDELHER